MRKQELEALGTHFTIVTWDEGYTEAIAEAVEQKIRAFDATYSRFIPTSLISTLRGKTGTFAVPSELIELLRAYMKINQATEGKINPCIGETLESMGYDATYSFTEAATIVVPPSFPETVQLIGDTHLHLTRGTLLDLGALGKGFIVDRVYDFLRSAGLSRFMVDGSGDIRYYAGASGEAITCALQHPTLLDRALGTVALREGSLCASTTALRSWGKHTHYVDPHTLTHPSLLATWVLAKDATTADALSSALFFASPEQLSEYTFDYCIVTAAHEIKTSEHFTVEWFT